MNRKDKTESEIGNGFLRVKIVGGGVEVVTVNSIVGYCHSSVHSGYVTKNVVKRHDCIKKECALFEGFYDYPFWESFQKTQEIKVQKKLENQEQKRARKERELYLEEIKNEASRWVIQLGYPILISSVKEIKTNYFIVFYASESYTNDVELYYDIAVKLHDRFSAKFSLRRIKKANGGYAKPSEII